MSERSIIIPLPEYAPQGLEQTLNMRVISEMLICEYLIMHYERDENGETFDRMTEVVEQFCDETMWRILDYRFPYVLQRNQRDLLDAGDHSEEDQKQLDHFLELHGNFVLVRSQALVCLKERGYDINRYGNDLHERLTFVFKDDEE